MSDLVVISVGTDVHPFDRLVGWAAAWAAQNPECKVVLQRGTAKAPDDVESHELIPHDELRDLFRNATAVVSHGGPSTVMDARMSGRFPIVVPRDPKLGEHVDDHQLRFAAHLAEHGLARLATTEAEFVSLLEETLEDPEPFTIPVEETVTSAGVVRFGEVVDEVLGIETTLRIYELDGVDERQGDRRRTDRRRDRWKRR